MQVAEGLEWLHIYWLKGVAPKHAQYRNSVTDPPCAGWQHAFVLRGEKRSTIFCPYSFQAYTMPNHSAEMMHAEEPKKDFRLDWLRDMVERKWKHYQGWGMQLDYDTCALVLKRLGLEVPAQVMTGGGEDDRKKGGKEVGSALLKPVKAGSKRGKFLRWFLDGEGSRSVREAMAEFSMTRSNALSYLYMIQKDHGIGYELVGDIATVTLPEGCTDPFNREQPTGGTVRVGTGTQPDDHSVTLDCLDPAFGPASDGTGPIETEKPPVEDDDDDSWLD